MLSIPLHPMVVHLPLALTFVLPILVLVFAYMIKINKIAPAGWLIIIGLQAVITGTGYIALETGETEEHEVKKAVSKKIIHEHEEASEIFVAVTVVALVLSIVTYFIREELQFYLYLAIALVSLVACYFAFVAGKLGAELVYRHGAASVYATPVWQEGPPQGILPTPGMNTSESPFPVDEGESMNVDDHEYIDEESESSDEDKLED